MSTNPPPMPELSYIKHSWSLRVVYANDCHIQMVKWLGGYNAH